MKPDGNPGRWVRALLLVLPGMAGAIAAAQGALAEREPATVEAVAIAAVDTKAVADSESSSHAAPSPVLEPRSGYYYQSEDIRAQQDDDFANPGMLWVDQGAVLWREAGPQGEPACAHCHEDPQSLRGAAVRYPLFDPEAGRLLNLEERINRCRSEHQQLPALDYESEPLLALTALVAHQSRGMPIRVSIAGPARSYFEEGREYFYTRRGQMNLACHHCHELNAGRYLRGDRLSQGQPTGYPIYRLDWQTLGSLQRRLRFCNTGVRAEPFDFGSPVYLSLELFLAWRAGGLASEAPAVRR